LKTKKNTKKYLERTYMLFALAGEKKVKELTAEETYAWLK